MVLPLQKSLIHIMNTVRKRIEWRIQWRMKWTILMTFSKWTLWKKKDQTSNYCEFQAISDARLMSRICSDRLQNFIFVQWELVPDKAVKWSDPFPNSEKNGAWSVYRRKRIKVALNLVSFHGKVTNQNDTQDKYSLILNWQFSFIQHL